MPDVVWIDSVTLVPDGDTVLITCKTDGKKRKSRMAASEWIRYAETGLRDIRKHRERGAVVPIKRGRAEH